MPVAVATGRVGERLPRTETLRQSADYLRCYRRGRRVGGSLARLHYAHNSLGRVRLGITASRKVGNAVVRNRLKRRVREIFRRWPERPRVPPVDVVVHFLPGAGALTFPELRDELLGLFGRLVRREQHPPGGRR